MLKNITLKTAVKASLKMLPVIIALCLSLNAHATLKIYPALPNMQGCQFSYTLQVKETGQSAWNTVPLYNALVTNGSQLNTTVANFDCDGPIDVKITFNTTVTSAGVFPASLNVTPSFSGNTITFSLSGPKKFYVDINGDHYNKCMHILANPVETAPPTQGDPNVIFVPTGTFVDSTVSVPSGKTLYIQGGAAVRSVSFNGVSNAKLLGRGFIYRPGFDAMEIKNSSNITVDGIIGLNHGWDGGGGCGIRFGQSTNVSISNTASFSSKKWGDAYDIFCCNGVNIDNVFIRTHDDAIAFYGGGKSGFTGNCKNITVSNSTLLPDLAQSLHVGVYGDPFNTEIRDVTCTNIDIINWSRSAGRPPIYFTVGDAVRAANFHFNNIRIQDFVNSPMIHMNTVYNGTYNYGPGRSIDSIYYTNVSYTGANVPFSSINGYDSNRKTKNVFFTDLTINGSKIGSASAGNVSIGSNVQNVVFITTGATPAVTSTLKPSGTRGTAFNYTITASNSPTSYSATGLPSGLSINTSTGVISGTPTVAGVFNINASATNSSGTGTFTITLTIAPSGELIAGYDFDNTLADMSGNAFTATLNGSTVYTTGLKGNAISLNGSNYASLPKGIVNSADDITIATWVKLDTAITWTRIFDIGNSTSAYMYFSPRISTGVPRFAIKNGGTEQVIDGPSAFPLGWTHIAVTLSGNTGKLYINGDSVSANTGMTINPSELGATINNYIGRSQFADPYLKGSIDDFRIYNRALSASEIQAMLQLPLTITSATTASGTKATPFTYTITATNSPTSYAAAGLPSGLSINTSTGVISGTPSVSGTFNVGISASNSAGTGPATLTLTINDAVLSGTYKIIAQNSGKALDVSGASTADGASIIQWPYNGATNQQWTITQISGNDYKVISVKSGKAMDVINNSNTNGTKIEQRTYSSSDNYQIWTITDNGDGSYKFINKGSGTYLDVTGNSTADGALLEIWPYSGSNNQRFQLTLLSQQGLMSGKESALALNIEDDAPETSFYPNPAENFVTIALDSDWKGQKVLNLIDLSGKTLITKEFSQNSYELNVSGLPTGLYIIKIKDAKHTLAKRLIKK